MSLFTKIFGGSRSQSTSESHSWNNAYPAINSAFSPVLGYAQEGGSAISKLLGGDSSRFDAYKGATGFDFAHDQGENQIMTNLRSQGLGTSGAAMKALAKFGQGLQSTYADNYIKDLLGLSDLGVKAGGVMAGAGQESTYKSQSTASNDTEAFGKFLARLLG